MNITYFSDGSYDAKPQVLFERILVCGIFGNLFSVHSGDLLKTFGRVFPVRPTLRSRSTLEICAFLSKNTVSSSTRLFAIEKL
jgi:hypothetical protein